MEHDDFFFVLDSYSIGEARESLLGYALDETGFYTDYIGGELTGNGCYVRIAVSAIVELAVSADGEPISLHGYSVSKALKKDYPDDCIRLLPVDSKYNWDRVAENMEPGREYRFSVGEVVVESGESSFVEAILYEAKDKRFCLRNKFPVSNGRCGRQEWCFAVPEKSGTYQLLVYAGVAGKTENIGVYYKNVNVELGAATNRKCRQEEMFVKAESSTARWQVP